MHCCRRLSALAMAAAAVKGAVAVLDMLAPEQGAPVKPLPCSLLAQAARLAGIRDSEAWSALQDIEEALDVPESLPATTSSKVWAALVSQHYDSTGIVQGLQPEDRFRPGASVKIPAS